MVEAAGRLFHSFRSGPDYAFIPVARHAGRVIRPDAADPSARPASRLGASMSLYRAGLRLALFLPLGVAMAPAFLRAMRFQGSPM